MGCVLSSIDEDGRVGIRKQRKKKNGEWEEQGKGNDENDDDIIKKKNKSTESNEEPRRFFVNQFRAANQPLYPTATTPSLSRRC